MAYKVIILYQLYMPSYFLGTFTEYPYLQHPEMRLCVDTRWHNLKRSNKGIGRYKTGISLFRVFDLRLTMYNVTANCT